MKKDDFGHLAILAIALIVGIIIGYYRDPTSGATVTLAIVTMYYAWQTRAMVDELRKDRYIAFLDKRLEKLYTPLLNLENEIQRELQKMKTSKAVGFETVESLKDLNKKLDELRMYTHLASNELKLDLEKFLADFLALVSDLSKEKYEREKIFTGTRLSKAGIIPLTDRIKNQIKEVEKEFNKIIKTAKEEAEKYRDKLIDLRDYKVPLKKKM
ncbi:hypothetical protein DRP04_03320 [Archaeoglobales archaeon]|nr:MAG: hypothetical protein DRP04_03320 [Archaeoglobales archaeon]